MKITKILAAEASPAKAILDRARHLTLTSAERADLPAEVTVGEDSVETAVAQKRPLEVGDVLLDDGGHFYVVDAAPEAVMLIKGEEDFASEVAVALLNRGVRVAQMDEGFAIVKDDELVHMLTDAGVELEEAHLPFDPIKLPKRHEGCCCGHHHHEHGEGCGCGHHHDHEHGEGCGCGGDHHHQHHHEEGECCCGGHHHDHEHGEGCGCGGDHHHHHHHEEGECCCGGHHHDHEHGDDCGCGGEHHHHHHHEEGECCCGGHHDHEHGEECGCGDEHHHHQHQHHYHHEDAQCGCQKK